MDELGPPISIGVEWFDMFKYQQPKEAYEMNKVHKGELALVEVHGLPGDNVKAFSYRATYDVTAGQQVQVPAPEWSISVTGREYLPGFVLGASEETGIGDIREIIPVQPVPEGIKALLSEWEEQAHVHEQEAERLQRGAEEALDRADEIRNHVDSVKRAIGEL